jgi:hypothetical protein
VRLYSRSRATAYFLLWKVAYCCSCVCCRNLVNSSAAQPGGVVLVRATDDGAEDGSEAVSDIVVDSEVPDPLSGVLPGGAILRALRGDVGARAKPAWPQCLGSARSRIFQVGMVVLGPNMPRAHNARPALCHGLTANGTDPKSGSHPSPATRLPALS